MPAGHVRIDTGSRDALTASAWASGHFGNISLAMVIIGWLEGQVPFLPRLSRRSVLRCWTCRQSRAGLSRACRSRIGTQRKDFQRQCVAIQCVGKAIQPDVKARPCRSCRSTKARRHMRGRLAGVVDPQQKTPRRINLRHFDPPHTGSIEISIRGRSARPSLCRSESREADRADGLVRSSRQPLLASVASAQRAQRRRRFAFCAILSLAAGSIATDTSASVSLRSRS